MLRNVMGRDEGNYRCKVHFKGSPSWSQRITLSIKDPPGFPRIQDEAGRRLEGPIGPYEDGSTVRMMCMSSGEPPPGLVWGGLGSVLGGGSSVEREGNVAKTWLNVVASRATADSTITCSTINESVSTGFMNTVSVTLRVNLPPLRLTLETPGDWVSGGQQTTFRCRVVGASPEPVVQWWLGSRQLTSHSPIVTTLAGNVSVSTLKLTPEPGDHGVPLVCKAFSPNLPGTVMHQQITLAVHFVPVATLSIAGGGGSGVREGGMVTFSCHIKANPRVYNVTWFHNGRPLRRLQWGAQVSNTTLRLFNVTADMRGLYTCVASNSEGDGQSNAVNLNVEFAPVCERDQQQDYVTTRGGSVTISCSVQAYPSTVTFTWALKKNVESPPERLHSVGREEGLTGRYTLNRLEEENVEVWCFAKNAVGNQVLPCKFNVYTQGRPGPVNNCTLSNQTASGFEVRCLSGPLRSMNTIYTLLVYAQSKPERPQGTGGGSGQKQQQQQSQGQQVGAPSPTLGQLVRNITTNTPFFEVGGLQAGQEFALVIRVSNEEGVSPPVVHSAFTLKDNAQTVIGMPSGVGGRSGTTGGGSEGSIVGGSSPGGTGGSGGTGGNAGGGGGGVGSGDVGGGDEDGGVAGRLGALIPPMIIVLVASVGGILMVAILIILLLKRRGRNRRLEREMEQVKLNEEMVFVQSRTPDTTTSRETPVSIRKNMEGNEGGPGGSSSEGGGDGGGGSSGGKADVGMMGGGNIVIMGGGSVGGGVLSVHTPEMVGVGAAGVMGGGVMGGVSSVEGGSFGPCNGDVLTTTSRDPLLGARVKQETILEPFRGGNTTLPILGIQKLGEDPGRHVVLEGMRPLGSALSTSCSSFRSGVPTDALGSVGGLASLRGTTGLIETPSTSSSHLLQVTLIPENVGKDRSPTRVPRVSEGVSVL